jgi:hypothetical protein
MLTGLGELGLAINIAMKLIPAIKAAAKAARKDSPGGKKVTKREREAIIRKIFPVVEEVVDEVVGLD